MQETAGIKEQLVKHLKGGEAFMPVDKMLKEMEYDKLGIRLRGLPYSFYELFFHIWFTQNDILKYCTRSDYEAPQWPEEYWPRAIAPENKRDWEELKSAYMEERQQLAEFIMRPENALFDSVPSNPGHSLMRSMLLVIEHTAYHSGQLLIVLRHLGLHSS